MIGKAQHLVLLDLSWEVQCNGMEISQFTYFQQMGGIDCKPVSLELTYGLERLAMFVQRVDNIFDIQWNQSGITYGEIYAENENNSLNIILILLLKTYYLTPSRDMKETVFNLLKKNYQYLHMSFAKSKSLFQSVGCQRSYFSYRKTIIYFENKNLVQKCCYLILENNE